MKKTWLLLSLLLFSLNVLAQGHGNTPVPTRTITPTPTATPTPMSLNCNSLQLRYFIEHVRIGGGDPTKARPQFAARMLQECNEYLAQGGALGSVVDTYNEKRPMVAEKLQQWENIARNRTWDVARPIEGIQQSHDFWMGQGIGSVLSQQASDMPHLLSPGDFWDCWDIGIHGVCIDIDISWSGIDIDIDLFRSYFWPVQLAEGVRHRGFSAYIEQNIVRLHVSRGDDLIASNARGLARGNLRTVQRAFNSTARDLGSLTDLQPVALTPVADVPQGIVNAVRNGPYSDLENRAYNPGGPGFQQTENRVLRNAVFSTVTRIIRRLPVVNIFGPCHVEKSTLGSQVMPAISEGPIMALFSRGLENNMIFPGMVQKTTLPMGTIGCSIYDSQQGNPRLRAPRDLLFPAGNVLPAIPNAITANCGTGNQGNIYALINSTNSNDGRTATEQSMLRGIKLTSYLVRRGVYSRFYYEFVEDRDKVQWMHDDPMVEKEGRECHPFTVKDLSYARDFRLADSDQELAPSDAPWNVNYIWRKFECCNSWNSDTDDGACYGSCPDDELIR